MYYSPPKSSCWGHSLRKMKPDLQKELFDQFFAKAIKDYAFQLGGIFYQPSFGGPFSSPSFDTHFLKLLNVKETQPAFSNLNEEQFNLCLNELLENPSLFVSGKEGATVHSFFLINTWNINGRAVPTKSHMHIYYGARPLVTPGFSFDSMDEFNYFNQIFQDLKICKLNPKHIKKVKR